MAITISNAYITKLQMASDGSFNIIEDFNGTAGFISASAVGEVSGGGGDGTNSVTLTEVGGNVVMTYSVYLNTTDLTFEETVTAGLGEAGGIGAASATFISVNEGESYDLYSEVTPSSTFWMGHGGGIFSSRTGDVFGVVMQGDVPYLLAVPSGYTSNDLISGTMTFTGITLEDLGISTGSYTYSWGSGANAESFDVVIS